MLDKTGLLAVRTTTAGGALPVKGTVIHITGAEEGNRDVEYSILTDLDGITEVISLPAPSMNLSLSPGAREQSYALYNIDATADGYYTRHIANIAIFEGVESIQPINMIPLSLLGEGAPYPHGSLDAIITENENLE